MILSKKVLNTARKNAKRTDNAVQWLDWTAEDLIYANVSSKQLTKVATYLHKILTSTEENSPPSVIIKSLEIRQSIANFPRSLSDACIEFEGHFPEFFALLREYENNMNSPTMQKILDMNCGELRRSKYEEMKTISRRIRIAYIPIDSIDKLEETIENLIAERLAKETSKES